MHHDQNPSRSVCWNGIHLVIPGRWDTIVKDHRHLIFEADLRPVFEIRWERVPKNASASRTVDRIMTHLRQEIGESLQRTETPDEFQEMAGRFSMEFFSWRQLPVADGALLTCRSCNTLVLLRIYDDFWRASQADRSTLGLLACHGRHLEERRWAIHDICFSIPRGFDLDSFTFPFGLSTISFRSASASLRLCRLAPASRHLRQHAYADIFSSFCNCAPDRLARVDERTLHFSVIPGILERVLSRLTRRKPFRWARFRHFPETDRILGLALESSLPIRSEVIRTIKDSYVIFQEENTGSQAHA